MRRKKRIILVSTISILLVVVLGGLSYILRLDGLVVNAVVVEGNSITPSSEIEEIVSENLAGSYVWLFPKNSIFLYPRNGITKEIRDKIKRIKSVELNIEDPEVLVIKVTERSPNASWCHLVDENQQEECFFLDASGFIYSKAPNFSGSVFLKFYGNINSDPIGKRYLPSEKFENLSAFIQFMKTVDLEIVSVSIDQFRDFTASLEEGGEIIFNESQSLEKLSTDIQSIFKDENFAIEFGSGAQLDYIDLRFGNKVYFQFQ